MKQVNIHEAKTHLSRLIEEAVGGEGFIIAKAGKPLVKVTAIEDAEHKPNPIGFMEGEFTVPDNFDTLYQDEIISLFEGAESNDAKILGWEDGDTQAKGK